MEYLFISILIQHLLQCEHYIALHEPPSFEQWEHQLILNLCIGALSKTHEKNDNVN